MKITAPVTLLGVSLLLSSTALAGQAGILSMKLENDVLSGGRDGHYTNGLETAWGFQPAPEHWSRELAGALPGWSADDLDLVAYRLSHQMYTPEEIDERRLQHDDRPYAGLLLGGFSLFATTQREGRRDTRLLTLDVGLVGDWALGKTVQRGVHRLTGSSDPKGWDNQLENELIFNIGYEKRWWQQHRFGGLELEYGPSLGGALGNLYSYLSTGAGMRLGQGLARSHSLPSLTPSPAGVHHFESAAGLDWFLYANLEGRYMAHNLLLDGNSFRDSHSVDREPWVGDAQLGVALRWERWQVSFGQVWRSREFRGQNSHDQFGALTLSSWL